MSERTWTVSQILTTTTEFLTKKDPSSPRLDAELLLSRVLKLNRVNLYVNFERVLTTQEINAYRELIRRRGNHEPVAYILGHKDFYNLKLKVTPATLIPRPETEHLVDEVLRLLRKGTKDEKKPSEGLDTIQNLDDEIEETGDDILEETFEDQLDDQLGQGLGASQKGRSGKGQAGQAGQSGQAGPADQAGQAGLEKSPASGQRSSSATSEVSEVKLEENQNEFLVADIGTGCGAIALAILASYPRVKVVASDISPEALKVAEENAKINNLQDRVLFLEGNLSQPLAGKVFDLICANLPYIPDAHMETLSPDVANFEPIMALKGGPEGLDLISELMAEVKPYLKIGGHLLLEIWPDSVTKLKEIAQAAGFIALEPLLDYSSKARIFVAKNPAP
ncbi:MAG: peptide chain release factor N(5)-glutamine methyltransferase [Deltaproteobacteria bacterium]|jgi:release factor glutamine methyltransferase|nr:peptide chain release factor N(5)-glutamine methyltransferase [Deltaproteobacteria bacterium]